MRPRVWLVVVSAAAVAAGCAGPASDSLRDNDADATITPDMVGSGWLFHAAGFPDSSAADFTYVASFPATTSWRAEAEGVAPAGSWRVAWEAPGVTVEVRAVGLGSARCEPGEPGVTREGEGFALRLEPTERGCAAQLVLAEGHALRELAWLAATPEVAQLSASLVAD